jgi:signal transduction histidine kinase
VRTAFLAAWLACALPAAVTIQAGSLRGWPAIVWSAAFVVFGAALVIHLRAGPRIGTIVVITQALAGLTMVFVSVGMTTYMGGVTLLIVAGELPYYYSSRTAWAWIACQSTLLASIFWIRDGWLGAVAGGGAYTGFQVFALGRTLLERSERAARQELARTAERLRISRDLHDTLGHHLTALSIQLEVASRLAEGPAGEHVREAHAITRLLLSDVRDVVSRIRENGKVDLAGALRPLAAGAGELRVHLEMPDVLYLEDSAQAQAMVRCVQETITNAARHGGARNLWIRVGTRAGGVELHASDDGRGAPAAMKCGNGLTGMRERFEEYAGHVEFTTSPGRGFEVRAFMPAAGMPEREAAV